MTLNLSTPCFRFKSLYARKNHFGIKGFLAPYNTKYLQYDVQLEITSATGTAIYTGGTIIDQATGAQTNYGSLPLGFAFPYDPTVIQSPDPGQPPADGSSSQGDVFTDTQWTHWAWNLFTAFSPPQSHIVQTVTLSVPYTLAMLEADVDALIDAFNPDTLPWGLIATVQIPASGTDFDPEDIFGRTLPPPIFYAADAVYYSTEYLRAIDFEFMLEENLDVAPVLSKLVSWVCLAGSYCQKEYILGYNGDQIADPSCVSGTGTCALQFQVRESDGLVLNQNRYTTITPNCQCAGA